VLHPLQGTQGVRVYLDGVLQPTACVPLQDDGLAHSVVVEVAG
jgi:hypothetical protein